MRQNSVGFLLNLPRIHQCLAGMREDIPRSIRGVPTTQRLLCLMIISFTGHWEDLFPIPEPPPGAPYKNFCEKGGRFGPHNFHIPQRDPYREDRDDRVYLTYFNAGLRVYDIRDLYLPKEIACYIPPDPRKRLGVLPKTLVAQSEDVLVDRRGYSYVTDKNHGLHILRCTV